MLLSKEIVSTSFIFSSKVVFQSNTLIILNVCTSRIKSKTCINDSLRMVSKTLDMLISVIKTLLCFTCSCNSSMISEKFDVLFIPLCTCCDCDIYLFSFVAIHLMTIPYVLWVAVWLVLNLYLKSLISTFNSRGCPEKGSIFIFLPSLKNFDLKRS